MTLYRHPGLLGDTGSDRFWPLLIVSALLHVALFWGFSRLHFQNSQRVFAAPVAMVDLTGPGLRGTATKPAGHPERAEAARPAPPPKPPKETVERTGKAIPVPERTRAKSSPKPELEHPKSPPKPVPPSSAARAPQPPPSAKPPPETKTIPKNPLPAPERTAPAPKPREAESPEDHVAERIAKLREKRGVAAEDPVSERIARIREKQRETNAEAEVAERIAKFRERQIQGSEAQVSRRIEALRDKYGTREPAKDSGRAAAGAGDGPLAVQGSGALGAAGFIEARYLQDVKDHIDDHWSVPEALKGKGYHAAVTVIVDRRGVITEWALQRSGNRFFDERVERAVAEANPLPPVPNGLPGQRFEYELRFSAP